MAIDLVLAEPRAAEGLWTYFLSKEWLPWYTHPAMKAHRDAWAASAIWGPEVTKCVERLRLTGVGKALYDRIEGTTKSLNIFAIPGISSRFMSAEGFDADGGAELKKYAPLLAFDPAIPLIYVVATVSISDSTTDAADPAPKTASVAVMPPWMVLAHELGHAGQWVSKRPWYLGRLGKVDELERDNLAVTETPLSVEVGLAPRRDSRDVLAGGTQIGSAPLRKDLPKLLPAVSAAFQALVDKNLSVALSDKALAILADIGGKVARLAPKPNLDAVKTKFFGAHKLDSPRDQEAEYATSVVMPKLLGLVAGSKNEAAEVATAEERRRQDPNTLVEAAHPGPGVAPGVRIYHSGPGKTVLKAQSVDWDAIKRDPALLPPSATPNDKQTMRQVFEAQRVHQIRRTFEREDLAAVEKDVAEAEARHDDAGVQALRAKLYQATQYALVEALNVGDNRDKKHVEKGSPRYEKTATNTFCNVYAHDLVTALGGYLPRVWWKAEALKEIHHGAKVMPPEELARRAAQDGHGHPKDTNGRLKVGADLFLAPVLEKTAAARSGTVTDLSANAMNEWMRKFFADFGWQSLDDDAEAAQAAANAGQVVIALATGKVHAGHINVILAESAEHMADRADGKVVAPLQSQAGSKNFKYGQRLSHDSDKQGKRKKDWWRDSEHKLGAFWKFGGQRKSPLIPPKQMGLD